jgi:hypothetical protein
MYNIPFIISVIVNVILGLLLLIVFIYYLGKDDTIIISSKPSCGGGEIPTSVCPVISPKIQLSTDAVYSIRTLNGLFLQGCFGCLDSPVACIEKGIIGAHRYNEDKFKFIKTGENRYIIQFVKWETPNILPDLYLIMVRKNEGYQLCLTDKPQQTATQFEIIPYYTDSSNGVNLYQIGSVISGSLIGEGDPSCLIKEGIPIVDGYNLSPNAPKGMDERSIFLIIPA